MRRILIAAAAALVAGPALAQLGDSAGTTTSPGLGGPASGMSGGATGGGVGGQEQGGGMAGDSATLGGRTIPPGGSLGGGTGGMAGSGSGVPGTATGPATVPGLRAPADAGRTGTGAPTAPLPPR